MPSSAHNFATGSIYVVQSGAASQIVSTAQRIGHGLAGVLVPLNELLRNWCENPGITCVSGT